MTTLTDDILPVVGSGRRIGPYELIREAGRGGAAAVYEAVDTRIGRRVAVKAIRLPSYLTDEQRDDTFQRLMREARAAGRLSHPNIVTMHDVGSEDELYYLVMEFLDGETLHQRLQQGPLPPSEAARIADQLANALDCVHAAGLLHRDIKPGNIMILPSGEIKLMDFGIARQIDETMLTQAGSFVGTPAYMSPEQCRGEDATAGSDTWALGVLLYQMLAGRRPFEGATIPSVMYQVTHEDPPPIAGVSDAVRQTVAMALDKDPRRRYATPRALALAFRRAVDGVEADTIEAEPETVWARGPKPPRRSPRPWPIAIIAAALLGALSFGASHRGKPSVPTSVPAARTNIVAPSLPAKSNTSTKSIHPMGGSANALDHKQPIQGHLGKSNPKAHKTAPHTNQHKRHAHAYHRHARRLTRGHGFGQSDFFAIAHQILSAYGHG